MPLWSGELFFMRLPSSEGSSNHNPKTRVVVPNVTGVPAAKRRTFARIAELNAQYADLPADFSDLSLVVISERLNVAAIATLDKDFDIYRRYRNQPFQRVFYP